MGLRHMRSFFPNTPFVRCMIAFGGLLWIPQEVNSVEAIKSAVEANLGAAFVSAAAVAKERQLGRLAVLRIQDIPLSRTLLCVTDPTRYCR